MRLIHPFFICYEEKELYEVIRASCNPNFSLPKIQLESISPNTDATSYC